MKNSAAVRLGDRMKAARGVTDEPVDQEQNKDKITQFPEGTTVPGLSAARKIK